MNVLDAMRGLLRRWYITIPGLVIAVGVALAVWSVTPPDYERSASQLLLPGADVLPEGATNQFLYLGGLAPIADVLTRAVSGDDALRDYREAGAEIVIARDSSVSGPLVLVTVTARDDATAVKILDHVIDLSASTLSDLQSDQNISTKDRVTISTISIDSASTVKQRSRVLPTAASAIGILLLTIAAASAVDGLMSRTRQRARSQRAETEPATLPLEDSATKTTRRARDESPDTAQIDLGAVVGDANQVDVPPAPTRKRRKSEINDVEAPDHQPQHS